MNFIKKSMPCGKHKSLWLRKSLFIMRCILLFLLLGTMQITASVTYSQAVKLSLSVENKPLQEVLSIIEQKSSFYFTYNLKQINADRKVSVDLKDKSVMEVLDNLLKGSDVKYVINDKHIVLYKGEKHELPLKNQQIKTIAGVVTDSNGEPVIGANVVEKGTTNGTITDIDGNFSLNISGDILTVSYIGYMSQEVNIQGKSTVSVKLQEDTQKLEEVVVVGYGVQKKTNLTGSVSTITSETLTSRPVMTVSQALAGLSSGVHVAQTSGRPGSDGASATIRIRGVGTFSDAGKGPLVIIDGIKGTMDTVNPNDIESMSVLKDAASASIYGSEAANGVILITTKKGSRNKTSISYDGFFSIDQRSNMLDMVSDYSRYMRLMNEGYENSGMAAIYSDAPGGSIDLWEQAKNDPNGVTAAGIPNYVAYPNTDWAKEVFRTAVSQTHNLSVSGGGDKVIYALSARYQNNPGAMENTGMERFQIRANIESTITKFLKVGMNTFGSLQYNDKANTDDVFNYLTQTTPGAYPYYNGWYGGHEAKEEVSEYNNPVAMLHQTGGKDQRSQFNTTLYAVVTFAKGLTWENRYNYQMHLTEQNSHTNASTTGRWRFSDNTLAREATVPSALTTKYFTYKAYNQTLESILRYNTTIKEDHDLGIMAGYNEFYANNYEWSATKKGLIDETITTLGSASEMIGITGKEADRASRSFFGRLNYAYRSKYLFEANMRYDGSSRFHKDKRWGVFPSFSAGWRLSEENFMNGLKPYIQNLKLRASWGQLGNNAIGNYDYQATYGKVNYSFNNNITTGLRQSKLPNNLLQWETTTVTNVGVDLSFLDDFNMELDVYSKSTDGILTAPPIYLTMGMATAPTRNTAKMRNSGVELSLGWRKMIGEVSLALNGNFSYNTNKVTKYKGKLVEGWKTDENGKKVYSSNIGDVASSTGQNPILEDHLMNEWYLHTVHKGSGENFNADGSVNPQAGPADGMIRTPEDMAWLEAMIDAGYKFQPNSSVGKGQLHYGDLIYADNNGDGVYGNSYDKQFTGTSAIPKFTYGLNINASWKNFDLSMIWSGSAGMKYWWCQNGYNGTNVIFGSAISQMVANDHYYYDPENIANSTIDGKYPRLTNGSNHNRADSDFWLYNASYLKLKNLQIGYTFPAKWIGKLSMTRARIFLSGENLLTITPYPGQDPEIGANVSYPTMRQFALGLNIGF